MRHHNLSFFLLIIVLAASSCKKYAEEPRIANPSYIRVFNNLQRAVDVFHSTQVSPFLIFLMDPELDGEGVPTGGGAISCDFLGTRQLFSLSYPINAANSSTGGVSIGNGSGTTINNNPVNYEYPGNAHVSTAKPTNGFDISSWASIPSGKHRIMFVVRPKSNVPFNNLSAGIRAGILVDTTIVFEKDEVYTMEVVSRDLDKSKYGLYVRKEQFIHEAFEDDKLYVGFVNLAGKQTLAQQNGIGGDFPEKISINYTYYIHDDINSPTSGVNPLAVLPGYDNTYYTTLVTKMDTVIPYLALPLLPQNAFFYQNLLRIYTPDNVMKTGLFYGNLGTLPCFSFNFSDANHPDRVRPLYCSADPVPFNNYDLNSTQVVSFTPNLNLIVNTNNTYRVYSTLNIMELYYDRVYLMQIQRGFNNVPNN